MVLFLVEAQVGGLLDIPPDRVRVIYNPIPERGAVPVLPSRHAPWFDRPVIMTAGRLMLLDGLVGDARHRDGRAGGASRKGDRPVDGTLFLISIARDYLAPVEQCLARRARP